MFARGYVTNAVSSLNSDWLEDDLEKLARAE